MPVSLKKRSLLITRYFLHDLAEGFLRSLKTSHFGASSVFSISGCQSCGMWHSGKLKNCSPNFFDAVAVDVVEAVP